MDTSLLQMGQINPDESITAETTSINSSSFLVTSTPNRGPNMCMKSECKTERQKNQQLINTNATISDHIAAIYSEHSDLKKKYAQLEAEFLHVKKPRTRGIHVTPLCQNIVRKVYKNLLSGTNDFDGFVTVEGLGSGFDHHFNQRVTNTVIHEVNALPESDFPASEIKEACKIYYKTIKEKSTRELKGTQHTHKKQSARSRIMRKKLERRSKAMTIVQWDNSTKEEVKKTLVRDYMSSEEELEYPPSPFKDTGRVRVVRALQWRSQSLTNRHITLYKVYWGEKATPKEITSRTTVLRSMGINSERPAPLE